MEFLKILYEFTREESDMGAMGIILIVENYRTIKSFTALNNEIILVK